MKKELNCGTLWYYNLSPEQALTVRYTIEMKDEIDGDCLCKAMSITEKRYPYLLERVVATPDRYYLEDCTNLPVVVKKTHHAIQLGGKEANYHQFALSYAGHTIFFNNTHALFDGRGRGPVLHTLMYYYCKLRYPNDEIEMPDVWLADSEINPDEYYDPFDKEIPAPKVPLPKIEVPQNIMLLRDMGLVHPSHFQLHHLSIDEKQLMACCKSNDATPNTAISLLMCRAIARLHPDSKKTISAGVYCDVRKPLNAELSHESLVTTLELEYAPEMRDMPFEEQNTIFRGKMLLQAEASNLLRTQQVMKQVSDEINALPTLQEKIDRAQEVMKQAITCHTFSVSYSGKSTFGSCDKYIAALYPQVEAKHMGILIEICAADGKFFITFIQEWKEDAYFNAFLKELTRQGLDYDILYSAQNEPATFSLE